MNENPRIAVWKALADHFLDTETRHHIPQHALLCVEAGLTAASARDVWRYEVTPAVWHNSWSLVGEWGYWDTEWLIKQIESNRGRWPNRPGLFANLIYRIRVHFGHRDWTVLERCIAVFEATAAVERHKLADDLTWLAQYFFDCSATAAVQRDPRAMWNLYTTVFRPIFSEALYPNDSVGNLSACEARIAAALGMPTIPCGDRG